MPFPPIDNFNPDFLAELSKHNDDYDAAVQGIVNQHKGKIKSEKLFDLIAAAHDGFLELLIHHAPGAVQSATAYLQQHNSEAFQALSNPKQGFTSAQNIKFVVATMAEAQKGFINKAIIAGKATATVPVPTPQK